MWAITFFGFISLSYASNLDYNLSLYSKGEDVSSLQTFLKTTTCPNLLITGFFGNSTYSCVRQYQKSNNIIDTGYVGLMTRSLINKTISEVVIIESDKTKSVNISNFSDIYKTESRITSGGVTSSALSNVVYLNNTANPNEAEYASTVVISKKQNSQDTSYDIKSFNFSLNGSSVQGSDFSREMVFCVDVNNPNGVLISYFGSCPNNFTYNPIVVLTKTSYIQVGFLKSSSATKNLSYDLWCKNANKTIPINITLNNGQVFSVNVYIYGNCSGSSVGTSGSGNSNSGSNSGSISIYSGPTTYPQGMACMPEYGYDTCAKWVREDGVWSKNPSNIGAAIEKIGGDIAVASGEFASGAYEGGDCSGNVNAARNTGNSQSTGYIDTYAKTSDGKLLRCVSTIITFGQVVDERGNPVPNINVYADNFMVAPFTVCNGAKVATTDSQGMFSFKDTSWCANTKILRKILNRGPVLYVEGAVNKSVPATDPNFNAPTKPGYGIVTSKLYGGTGNIIIWKVN